MKNSCNAAVLLCLALPVGTAISADDSEDTWQTSGDARGGWFTTERTARDGAESDADEFKLRLRAAMDRHFSDSLSFRARVAGTYSSEQDETNFYLRGYPSTNTGLASGDATVDELYVNFAPPDAGWALRAGRMQTKFELGGVAAKSLDRNDSPNVDITWTDGIHLTQSNWLDNWKTHVILQHNHETRASVTTRGPMDFTESSSRISYFAGLQAEENPGPLVQRVIGLTFMPDSLASEGLASDVREDYVSLDAKLAAGWPLDDTGRRFLLGLETAYAFNTPEGVHVGTGATDSADGFAWQLAGNFYDIAPGHNLAIVTGRAGAGWLLSPDFRNNDRLHEIRYQWKFSPSWSMEARYRIRTELEVPATAGQEREDRDVYIRLSGKF